MLSVQGNGEAEDVAFVENRQSAGVYPHVLVEVSHAGAEFVRELYLMEEVCNDRILRLSLQVPRSDDAVMQRLVRVVGEHLVAADDEPRRTRTRELAMHQYVHKHLAKNLAAQRDA